MGPLVRTHVPGRAWVVTFAGTAVNLCLGILYAWSVWKVNLTGTASLVPTAGKAHFHALLDESHKVGRELDDKYGPAPVVSERISYSQRLRRWI